MFDKILFATTASPNCDDAAKVAFELAEKYGSTIYTLHVFGEPSRGFSVSVTDVRTGEREGLDRDYTEWVKEEMKNTYAKQVEKCDKTVFEARVGVPHTEILRMARKQDVDLIIMGAHTRQEELGAARHRDVVGSTMRKVAKGAMCPVLIISRPCSTCWWYFSNIVFGTDFSKASDSAFKFAEKVAKEIGCRLYIFHACDIDYGRPGAVVGQEEVEAKLQEAEEKIKRRYVSQLEDFDNYEIAVREGVPYVESLKFSREKQGDLIVMAHHTREIDPEEADLGSTVEQVVLRSSCPVASVNRPHKL